MKRSVPTLAALLLALSAALQAADAPSPAGKLNTTFFASKWHLGSKGFWPEDCGFDINKGGWEARSPMGGFYAPWENPNLPSGPMDNPIYAGLIEEMDTAVGRVLTRLRELGLEQNTGEASPKDNNKAGGKKKVTP